MHAACEAFPVFGLLCQRRTSGSRQTIDAAFAKAIAIPCGSNKTFAFQFLQSRIDCAFGELANAAAPLAEGRDDGVAVRGPCAEYGEQQHVELTTSVFLHTNVI